MAECVLCIAAMALAVCACVATDRVSDAAADLHHYADQPPKVEVCQAAAKGKR